MELLVPVLIFAGGATGFIALAFGIWRLLRTDRPYKSKQIAYECGEEPLGSAHGLFNSRFYVIALVFLLFEAELMFLFPWAVAVFSSPPTAAAWWFTAEIFLFVFLLAIGLAYVWRKGHFNWGKSKFSPISATNSPVHRSIYESFNKRQQN
ncbi:MAG: NADH-quinone oxidoreductase subunit A [Cytophagales bacterium]|nr:NADH-quinone oxidoreductase subunit A [Bernardetiaceae bacterium]MDW8210701.1 NADH-quinone oxidoreductase subunit A [Cytophagales bacterium]